MKITQTTERLFEIEFDDNEVEQLKDVEKVFGVETKDVIQRSIEQSLAKCGDGVDYIMSIVKKNIGK